MLSRSYPFTPGHRGVDTSIEAADELAPVLATLQRQVYAVIAAAGPAGATANEIADMLGWIVYRVRPRTSELSDRGEIIDSGRRRRNPAGRSVIVWTLPEHGEASDA